MTEPRPPHPRPVGPTADLSLVGLVARAVLDGELAALVWVLVEARVPLIVAPPPLSIDAGALRNRGLGTAGLIAKFSPGARYPPNPARMARSLPNSHQVSARRRRDLDANGFERAARGIHPGPSVARDELRGGTRGRCGRNSPARAERSPLENLARPGQSRTPIGRHAALTTGSCTLDP